MIGVVLWSDPVEKKAVFWCEDHGDLAYFDASKDVGTNEVLLTPGDMVEFSVVLERQIRRAQNPLMVEARVCNGLQDHLRDTADKSRNRARHAQVSNVVDLSNRQAQRRPA